MKELKKKTTDLQADCIIAKALLAKSHLRLSINSTLHTKRC